MKSYTITVNGAAYEVTVEENKLGTGSAAPARILSKPAAIKAESKMTQTQGSIKIKSPMPGKIINIKAGIGQTVKKGEVLLVLEAMKMENDVVALEDGTVADIHISTGDMVEAGDVLVSLN